MFPLKSDDIFRSDTRSPVLSRKFFVCATSGQSHACFCPVHPIAVPNCKNIRNRSIVVMLIELVNLHIMS